MSESHARSAVDVAGISDAATVRVGGNSQEQQAAEALILEGVGAKLEVLLRPRSMTLPDGARVDIDGVADGETVLVEVFAHIGPLKGGQRHKIATDALKLITLGRDREPRPRLILAFADPALATWATGRTWLASALAVWGVEAIAVELPGTTVEGLRRAQRRQYR